MTESQVYKQIIENLAQIDSLLKTVEARVVACEQAATDEREAINVDHRLAQTAGAVKNKVGYWQFDKHELKKFIELFKIVKALADGQTRSVSRQIIHLVKEGLQK